MSLGFLGNFHPVVVHFPIALLPVVVLLRLYGGRKPQPWIDPAISALLVLALGFAVLAVTLGVTTRIANGFDGPAVNEHALFAFSTLIMVALTVLLRFRAERVGAALRASIPALRAAGRASLLLARVTAKILKWVLIVVLFPAALLLWLLYLGYRRTIGPKLTPRLANAYRAVRDGARTRIPRFALLGEAQFWKDASLAASLVLVLLTGLKGANVAHGEGHLTRNMPTPLAALFGVGDARAANSQLDHAYFDERVLPALRRSCVKCHGPEKQRAGLRLDSYGQIVASSVVKWQDPYDSEIVRRVLLPRDHRSAMPPKGKSHDLRTEDVMALVGWLQGHSLETLAQGDGGLTGEYRALASSLPPVDDAAIDRLNAIEGLHVRRYVTGFDLLVVNLGNVPEDSLGAAIGALSAVADHVVDLSFEGRRLNPACWMTISGMRNVRRLNLSRSDVGDADLKKLAGLERLHWLNLSGTPVLVDAKAAHALLPEVETLYLPVGARKES